MQDQDFLAAIADSPDDTVPRLVYADWLDERGDPRGEFIRVQCERETLDERDPHCVDLDFRERSLLSMYRNIWARPVRKWGRIVNFRRGFVEDITLRADKFLEHGEELLSLSPIRRVKLTHIKDHVEALANSPLLSRLESLNLRDGKLGLARLKTLLKSPYLSGLRGLDVSFNGLGASAIRELAKIHFPGSLKSLALDSCNASDAGIKELLESHLVNHLETLELRSNGLTQADALRLADCPKLRQLRELHLDFNAEITNAGVRRLLESENLQSLRVLSLRHCQVGRPDDSEPLFPIETPLKNLVRLNLENNWMNTAAFGRLAETAWVDDLVYLDVSHNFCEGAAFDPLFQPGRFPRLRSLWISWNWIDHRIMEQLTLLATSYWTMLDLGGDIGNKGAKLLAQSDKFANVTTLLLRGYGITDPGARALAKSKTLNRIVELQLTTSSNETNWKKSPGISSKVQQLLIDRFGKAVCNFS